MNQDFKTRRLICSTVAPLGVIFLLVATSFFARAAENSELKPALQPLTYFLGDWDCSGKFVSSGKGIEAQQHFASDLDGSWILFRHDDKPPLPYHALAEWGWDQNVKEFIMTGQDSAGGLRFSTPRAGRARKAICYAGMEMLRRKWRTPASGLVLKGSMNTISKSPIFS
jgi:hypothetical protein